MRLPRTDTCDALRALLCVRPAVCVAVTVAVAACVAACVAVAVCVTVCMTVCVAVAVCGCGCVWLWLCVWLWMWKLMWMSLFGVACAGAGVLVCWFLCPKRSFDTARPGYMYTAPT